MQGAPRSLGAEVILSLIAARYQVMNYLSLGLLVFAEKERNKENSKRDRLLSQNTAMGVVMEASNSLNLKTYKRQLLPHYTTKNVLG